VTDILVEPTQNTTTTPGTYCAAPHDTPGASSWAVVISFLQDWGNTPSLSEFTFTNDGALCDFEFTSTNPDTVPSMTGQAFVTATAFGGPAGASWAVATQRWSCPAKPTVTPPVVMVASTSKKSEAA
jgi:hypothetical protein